MPIFSTGRVAVVVTVLDGFPGDFELLGTVLCRSVADDMSFPALVVTEASNTLPETNTAPKSGWLEYYFPIGEGLFSGAVLVSGRVLFKINERSGREFLYRLRFWMRYWLSFFPHFQGPE